MRLEYTPQSVSCLVSELAMAKYLSGAVSALSSPLSAVVLSVAVSFSLALFATAHLHS